MSASGHCKDQEIARSLASSGPSLILATDLVEEDSEDQHSADGCFCGNLVTEHNSRNANRNHLPCRHDDCKHNRPELLDGKEDTELTRRRCDGGDDVVVECSRICTKEFDYNGDVVCNDEPEQGDANSRNVDAQHHLERIYVRPPICGVDLVLPLACERVEANVAEEEDETP